MSYCDRLLFCWALILLIACEPADNSFAGHLVQLEREPTISVIAGSSIHFMLTFQVREGFHILAQEGNDEQFLATKLTFENTSDITITQINYPQPTIHFIKGLENPIWVYENSVPISIQLSVSSEILKGRYPFTAKMIYQACNDKKCFFSRELPLEAYIEVL
ncbi:MAG: protein-disulfide reductase DsbD domain-containing protein [Bacteroidota bacterium]